MSFPIAIGMLGFERSTSLPSKGRLVAELCIPIRAPSFNISGEGGASDAKLTDAAAASDSRDERLLAHWRKLREVMQ
ncbi:hypothetical protein [Sphingomonas sp. PP-CE-3A-406]|uniref:hypothetical protein n=1 Tax=Sphingomonas sp. PP-CE-3A-406 TaxID=2135659 RepID=UPI0011C4A299|nr:hypothetical protein [Sphingomonas sp. PP-CE-3A-406]